MFGHFFQQGSVISIILMVYAGNVMMECLRLDRVDPHGVNSPLILKHSLSSIFMFGSIPCAVWPAIYIDLFEGWIAGILAWVMLQILGAAGTIILRIMGPAIAFHFIAACIVYPIGYYLSISNLIG